MMQNNDLISRKALIELFCDLTPHALGEWSTLGIVAQIEKVPAVDAVVLPCKIGDPVYIIFNLKGGKPSHFVERKCVGIHITAKGYGRRPEKDCRYLVTKSDAGYAEHIPFAKIGETVFFAREEAEAALAERTMNDA